MELEQAKAMNATLLCRQTDTMTGSCFECAHLYECGMMDLAERYGGHPMDIMHITCDIWADGSPSAVAGVVR